MDNIEHINYIKTSKAIVYNTITTQSGLAEVWTKKLIVKPEIGFVNEFDFDEGYITKMQVIELAHDSFVCWMCVESDPEWAGTTISFALSEENNGTKIVLKHEGWMERTDFYRWCTYHWALFLYRLKNYCENPRD